MIVMKKGLFQTPLHGIFMILLLIVAVALFFFPVQEISAAATGAEEAQNPLEMKICKIDEDCQDNINGSKCVIIYPEKLEAFCGCYKNEHCVGRGSGICGTDNICS
jgi:hypothetical protein